MVAAGLLSCGGFCALELNLKTRQLEYFVCAAELKSISQAAEQLNTSQTALGTQLKQLEHEYGVSLFFRSSRGVELTEAGQIFYVWAGDILDRHRAIRNTIGGLDCGKPSSLSLGLAPSVAFMAGTHIIEAVAEQMPTVRLNLYEEHSHTLEARIATGAIELSFLFTSVNLLGFQCRPVLQEPLVFVVPHGSIASAASISLPDALRTSLVLPSDELDIVRQFILQRAALLGITPNVSYEVPSISTLKQVVIRGLASAILPLSCVKDEIQAGALDQLVFIDSDFERCMYVVYKSELDSRLVGLIQTAVESRFRSLVMHR